MVSGAGRTLTWTSFDKPATVVDAATRTAFAHGPDRARIVQTRTQGATTTTIVYVAGLFEQLGKTGEATKFVHYIFAGSSRVAIRTTDDAPTPTDKPALFAPGPSRLGRHDHRRGRRGRRAPLLRRLRQTPRRRRRQRLDRPGARHRGGQHAARLHRPRTSRRLPAGAHERTGLRPVPRPLHERRPLRPVPRIHPGPQPLLIRQQQPALVYRSQRVFHRKTVQGGRTVRQEGARQRDRPGHRPTRRHRRDMRRGPGVLLRRPGSAPGSAAPARPPPAAI